MARLSFSVLRGLQPFQFLKRFMPSTLLARTLLILITPVVLIQIVMGFVFWDRHWSKTTETLAEGIAGSVAMLVTSAEQNENFSAVQDLAHRNLGYTLTRSEADQGFSPRLLRKTNWSEEYLQEALQQKLIQPFRLRFHESTILLQVAGGQSLYTFIIPKKALFPKTIGIVIWWEVSAPLFFILIAVLFMRNQVRPLQTLVTNVEAFGKGRDIRNFKPSGSFEVRRVGRAFNVMRERIQRQITQRTEMLSGISHDLRTPLTRMKLQLALFPESDEREALLEDVREMEKMVDEYLAFAKGEETEKEKKINLEVLVQDLLKKFPGEPITSDLGSSVSQTELMVRPIALGRALKNVITNAFWYGGGNLWFRTSVTPKTVTFVFEDDGPGIPPDKREDVFRPFVRLDTSRNTETGGYGLGLAITRDIILSHGGRIFLDTSAEHGGLKVTISLPR
jgi:two-component system osmolarity sensor histidine kinase EnvZ